jgi:hypothetical protein
MFIQGRQDYANKKAPVVSRGVVPFGLLLQVIIFPVDPLDQIGVRAWVKGVHPSSTI